MCKTPLEISGDILVVLWSFCWRKVCLFVLFMFTYFLYDVFPVFMISDLLSILTERFLCILFECGFDLSVVCFCFSSRLRVLGHFVVQVR